MAKRIVKMFKEKTLDVIENEIDKLADVEGIGQKRIGMIRKAWEEQKEIRAVMIFLQSMVSVQAMRPRSISSMAMTPSILSRRTPIVLQRYLSA